VQIGLTGWQREAAEGDHRELLALIQRADALGFDSLWLAEYHFRRTGLPYPSPLLLAAAVFARTERMRVGTGVTLVPLHHPLILAEQLAQLDVQGDGRLDIGIGRPNDAGFLTALGIDSATKHERFVHGYDLLLRAWTDGRVTSSDGPWQFSETEVGPVSVSSRTSSRSRRWRAAATSRSRPISGVAAVGRLPGMSSYDDAPVVLGGCAMPGSLRAGMP